MHAYTCNQLAEEPREDHNSPDSKLYTQHAARCRPYTNDDAAQKGKRLPLRMWANVPLKTRTWDASCSCTQHMLAATEHTSFATVKLAL